MADRESGWACGMSNGRSNKLTRGRNDFSPQPRYPDHEPFHALTFVLDFPAPNGFANQTGSLKRVRMVSRLSLISVALA